MNIKTSNKNWKLFGINLIPSDSIYQKVAHAIETDNLSEGYLQKVTGSNAPIIVDRRNRTIQFY